MNDLKGASITKSRINIKTNFSAGISLIHGDENQLQQVFVNLINNAVQAMNRKGRLVLSTMTSGDYVEIKVKIPTSISRKQKKLLEDLDL